MRFSNVFCSQCGADFGPGDFGFSHCINHLVAAAPDLLAALEIAVDAMNNTNLFETEIKQGRAAITKAKGE